nr:nitrate respiration regulation accessory nitrate sensor NreA [Mammaliicoccus sp. Marseille-Q6498]
MSYDFNFQEQLDRIRDTYKIDFVGLAMSSEQQEEYIIKWQYVSGNLNHRYKHIVLRNGRGIAGIVIKSGKEITIKNVKNSSYYKHIFNYPIIQSEQLTALIAMPLWKKNRVCGVLMIGQRNDKPLPVIERKLFAKFGPFYGKDMINS